jgi:streptomycin 6-kinase
MTEDWPLSQTAIVALRHYFPATAEQWIEGYPQLMQGFLKRWQLTIKGQATGGWPTNLVFFVEQAGRPCVLKFGHPNPEIKTEAIALAAFTEASRRSVRLLAVDEDNFGILLERLTPGITLREAVKKLDDSGRAAMVCEALELHRTLPLRLAPNGLPRFSEWLHGAHKNYSAGASPSSLFLAYLARAEDIFEKFRDYPDSMLHGDLHHENILTGDQGWMAIDPKGVIGPEPLECGRFLHNFFQDEMDTLLTTDDRITILRKRFNLASEMLPYGVEQLAEITFLDATLSTCWSLNAGDSGAEGLAILEALTHMMDK